MKTLLLLGLRLLAPFITLASAWALWRWPLLWPVAAMVLYVATWVFYGHLMSLGFVRYLLQKEQGEAADLPHGPRQLAAVLLLAGYTLDYLLNAAVFTLLLLRLPLELTVSEALNRYGRQSTWRGKVARYFGVHWINPLDHKSRAEGKQHIDTTQESASD